MARPSKAEIVKYWEDWLIAHGFDLGEPACWTCSCWWGTKYDIKYPNASRDEIYNCWNKVRQLQRCHIIPESLGGSNEDPSNFFLMCKQCHDLAPDTTSKEMFFTWVEKQSWLKRKFEQIKTEMDNFDIIENEYEEIVKIILSHDFEKWVKNKITIHFNQMGYGPKLKSSTLIAAVREYQKIIGNK